MSGTPERSDFFKRHHVTNKGWVVESKPAVSQTECVGLCTEREECRRVQFVESTQGVSSCEILQELQCPTEPASIWIKGKTSKIYLKWINVWKKLKFETELVSFRRKCILNGKSKDNEVSSGILLYK